MVPWVEQWEQALEDLVDEDREYDDSTYDTYLRWYVPATCTRVGYTPSTEIVHVPSVSDTYAQHHRQAAYQANNLVRQSSIEARHAMERIQNGIQMTASEVFDTFRRIYEKTTRGFRLTSYCADPGALAPVPTAAPDPRSPSASVRVLQHRVPRGHRLPSRGLFGPSGRVRVVRRLPGVFSASSGRAQVIRRPSGVFSAPSGRARVVRRFPGVFPATTRRIRYNGWVSRPSSSYCRRVWLVHSDPTYTSTWDSLEAGAEMHYSPLVEPPVYQSSHLPADFSDYFFGSHQEIGPSQLSEAPPVTLQQSQSEHATPEPQPRPQRDVGAPDRFTFPSTQLGRARKSRAYGSVMDVKPKMGRP